MYCAVKWLRGPSTQDTSPVPIFWRASLPLPVVARTELRELGAGLLALRVAIARVDQNVADRRAASSLPKPSLRLYSKSGSSP